MANTITPTYLCQQNNTSINSFKTLDKINNNSNHIPISSKKYPDSISESVEQGLININHFINQQKMKEKKNANKKSVADANTLINNPQSNMSEWKINPLGNNAAQQNPIREMYPYHYKYRNIFPITSKSNNPLCNNYTQNISGKFNRHF
ncbi:MAG: hypothetical protein IPJ79_06880 [Bacteroidetes bacterium]|nr:hypothetical protein [Bacteroidota bacterium]